MIEQCITWTLRSFVPRVTHSDRLYPRVARHAGGLALYVICPCFALHQCPLIEIKLMASIFEVQSGKLRAHGRAAIVLHWGFIGVFVYALTKQLDEVEELEDISLLQTEMAFATVFLVLLISRFVYMRSTRPTALPSDTPRLTMLAAQSVHLGMYVSLSMIAVTGLVIGGLYWSGIKDGTGMEVTLVAHEFFVQASYLLILLHVSAAIYHRRKSDGIWSTMVPFIWKESTGDPDRT